MEQENNDIGCCEFCGGPVVRKRALDGARYYVPIGDVNFFSVLNEKDQLDLFIFDRLRRAERIIEDLRAQLRKQDG